MKTSIYLKLQDQRPRLTIKVRFLDIDPLILHFGIIYGNKYLWEISYMVSTCTINYLLPPNQPFPNGYFFTYYSLSQLVLWLKVSPSITPPDDPKMQQDMWN